MLSITIRPNKPHEKICDQFLGGVFLYCRFVNFDNANSEETLLPRISIKYNKPNVFNW